MHTDHDPRRARTRRLNALAFTFLLLAGNLALLSAEPAEAGLSPGTGSEGMIRFVGLDDAPLFDPDGDGPLVAEVHGTGVALKIRLTDNDLTNDEVSVRVKSSSDSVGEDITLERQGPRGAQPFGRVVDRGGFDLHLPVQGLPSGSLVYVDEGNDGFTVPDPAAGVDGDPVYFSPDGAGTLGLNDVRIANLGSGLQPGTQVDDGSAAGSNDGTADADHGKATGALQGQLAFGDGDNDGKMGPLPDVLYWDTDSSGDATEGDVRLSGPRAGTIVLDDCAMGDCDLVVLDDRFGYIDEDRSGTYTWRDRLVVDVDEDARLSIGDVRLAPLADVITYVGFVGVETSNVPDNGQVRVQADDKITVVYVDTGVRGPGTQPGASEDSVVWRETRDGEIRLDRDDYFGIGEEIEITVEDKDIPKSESVFCVHVASDADPRGFNMTVNKVSDGLYRGNLRMSSEESWNGLITRSTSFKVDGSFPDPEHPTFNPCEPVAQTDQVAVPQILVEHGQKIHVNYTIAGYDERGRREDNPTFAVFHETESGRIQWMSSDYRQVISEVAGDENPGTDPLPLIGGVSSGRTIESSSGWLRVEDPDMAGRGRIVINVRSLDPSGDPRIHADVDPTGLQVTLYETSWNATGLRGKDFGTGTGEFIGFIGFHTDEPTPGEPASKGGCDPERRDSCQVKVKKDAILSARYKDPHDRDGNETIFEARVRWGENVTGEVKFTTSDYQTPAFWYNTSWTGAPSGPDDIDERCVDQSDIRVPCHPHRGYVELVDPDIQGEGTYTVRLTNPQRDPLGISLILQETSPGVFRGEFGFNHTHSSDSQETPHDTADQVIWALGCDPLRVTYEDTHDVTGQPRTVSDTIEQVRTIRMEDTSPSCGDQNHPNETLLGQNNPKGVFLRDSPTSSTDQGAFYGYRSAWVHLYDGELNRDGNARDINDANVLVTTSSYGGQWYCCNTPPVLQDGREVHSAGSELINVTVLETSISSSHFVGNFSFVPADLSAPGNGADASLNQVPVQDGDTVCVYWLYQNQTGENQELWSYCSIWRASNAPDPDPDLPSVPTHIEFRSRPQQGATMSNSVTAVPEARVFYNGTGARWVFNQDLGDLDSAVAWVYVRDTDDHPDVDSSPWADTIEIQVRSESMEDGISIDLFERYGRQALSPKHATFGGYTGTTGDPWVVEGSCDTTLTPPDCVPDRDYQAMQDDRGFIGVLNFTTEEVRGANGELDRGWYDRNDKLFVRDGDTVSAYYVDPVDRTGKTSTYVAHVDWHETHTAAIELDRTVYRNHTNPENPLNVAEIRLTDKDLDTGVDQQRHTLQVKNQRTGREVPVELEETGPSTGEFLGKFRFTPTRGGASMDPNDAILEVADEDTFAVSYTDERNAHGREVRIEATAKWFDTTSAWLTLDKDTYTGYGDKVQVTLQDRNLDLSSDLDEVFVWAISESDGAGEYIKLTETGGRSGVFIGELPLEASRTAQNGRLHIQDQDELFVHYLDREADQHPALNDDVLVKKAVAKFDLEENQPPRFEIETIPPISDEYPDDQPPTIPVHLPERKRGSSRVAFFVDATDLDGEVVRFEMDMGDGSPLIVNVDGRGPGTDAIVHSFGVDPFYKYFGQEATIPVTLRAWDDAGAINETVVLVDLIRYDSDAPGPITDLEVVEDSVKSDAVALKWTAVPGNEGACDPTVAACSPPDTYEVFYSAGDISDEEVFDDLWHPELNPDGRTKLATNVVFDPAPFALPESQVPGASFDAGVQEATVFGLDPDTEYTFSVRARDDDPVRHCLLEDIDKRTGEILYNTSTSPPTDDHRTNKGLGGCPDPGLGKTAGDRDFTVDPVRTLVLDTTVPEWGDSPLITCDDHMPDVISSEPDVTCSWPPATDDESVVFYRWAVNNEASGFVLDNEEEQGTMTDDTEATATGLSPNRPEGDGYYFWVAACNTQAGCSQSLRHGPILIEAADGDDDDDDDDDVDVPAKLREAIGKTTTNVSRSSDGNTITWTLEALELVPGTPIDPVGVHLWFAQADETEYLHLVTFTSDDQEFKDGEFLHTGGEALPTTKYKVTPFYGNTPEMGFSQNGDPNDVEGFDSYASASAGEVEVPGGGIPWWVWLIVGVVGLVLLAAVIGVLIARRGGDETFPDDGYDTDTGYAPEEQPWDGGDAGDDAGDGWPGLDEGPEPEPVGQAEPAPEPEYQIDPPVAAPPEPEPPREPQPDSDPLTHALTCPACDAAFTAHGQKPMVTECPSCGVKGVLR